MFDNTQGSKKIVFTKDEQHLEHSSLNPVKLDGGAAATPLVIRKDLLNIVETYGRNKKGAALQGRSIASPQSTNKKMDYFNYLYGSNKNNKLRALSPTPE